MLISYVECSMQVSDFLKELEVLTTEDLVEVKGLGEILAQNVLDFRESDRYNLLVKKFEELELQNKGIEIIPETDTSSDIPQTLKGEIVVITGSFEIPRPQIKKLLEQRGAKVTSAITGTTTILVAGEKAGSKLAKAEKFGTRIVADYTELL